MPKQAEHAEQKALIKWCKMHPVAKRIFAIPNGGARHIAVAAKMKAEGVRPGVPDLFLPVPRGRFCGLFIEMKAKGGRVARGQSEELEQLSADGYMAVVCWGWDSARETIENYLNFGVDSEEPTM